MLAYVFWHRPAEGVDASRYEDALVDFHRALAREALEGFHGSEAYATSSLPWLDGAGYEDWYLLEASFALDTLNRAAVTGPMEGPHRAIASLTGRMAAGVLGLVRGEPIDRPRAVWFAKPPGESYEALYARLPAGTLWRRQMVLGPTPEFCLVGAQDEPEGLVVERRRIV